jgi:hypothetical protein
MMTTSRILFPPTGFTPSPLTDAEVNPTLELDQILAPDPLPFSNGADTEADTPVEETPPTLEDLDDFFPSDGPDAPAAAWDAQSEETIQTLENLEDFPRTGADVPTGLVAVWTRNASGGDGPHPGRLG